MKTKISEVIRKKGSEVTSLKTDNSVYDAIQKMIEDKIGSLLVVAENEEIKGIFTERDALKQAVLHPDELKKTTLEEVMTTNLLVGIPEDTVEHLMARMTANNIRHIPIISANGKTGGLLSMRDLVKKAIKEIEHENRYLKDYISGKY